MDLAKLMRMGDVLEVRFAELMQISSTMCRGILRLGRVLEQEYGVPSFSSDESRVQARSLARAPLFLEGTVNAVTVLNLEAENQGITPSGGYYSNLGANAFQVEVVALDGTVTKPHTVPPGVSIAIVCYVTQIRITPLANNPANYQIQAR